MHIKHFKFKLLSKRRELNSMIGRAEEDVRAADELEVRDWTDNAVADEETSLTAEEADTMMQTLREVDDALERIENGTYGRCLACGRPIEIDRLEAVPWTQYCRKDQEQEDAKRLPDPTYTL
jgi:DnaK suppressor protein